MCAEVCDVKCLCLCTGTRLCEKVTQSSVSRCEKLYEQLTRLLLNTKGRFGGVRAARELCSQDTRLTRQSLPTIASTVTDSSNGNSSVKAHTTTAMLGEGKAKYDSGRAVYPEHAVCSTTAMPCRLCTVVAMCCCMQRASTLLCC